MGLKNALAVLTLALHESAFAFVGLGGDGANVL